ncbi:hypothetical protein CK489_36595 [Bradyrhizobium sp. UFLA03-84]|nr:hypothetical protein CK489_36595 [Bradyrhizobium sp. UFLA03-84]
MMIDVTIMPYGRACLACVVSAMLGGAGSAGPSLTMLASCSWQLYADAADADWFLMQSVTGPRGLGTSL